MKINPVSHYVTTFVSKRCDSKLVGVEMVCSTEDGKPSRKTGDVFGVFGPVQKAQNTSVPTHFLFDTVPV